MQSEKQMIDSGAVGTGRLWLVLVLGSLSAIGPLCMDMYLPALPKLAQDMDTTASMAQLSLTACLFGLALGQLLVGPLSDSVGRRRPLAIGMLVYVLATLLCAVSPSIGVFVALRFVQGAAGAAGIVLSRAIARDLYDGPALTRFFALLMLVNGVAPIAAPAFGGQLLQLTSWRGVFWALAAIGLLMLAAVWLGMPESLPKARRTAGGLAHSLRAVGRLLRDRRFMGYALTQGFVMTAMFAYIAGSPFVLQEMYGVSVPMYTVVFGVNGIGIIIAGQIAGRLAGKVDEGRLLNAGLAMAGAGGLLLLVFVLTGVGIVGIIPSFFLLVSSVGLVSASSFSLAMRDEASAAGSASALLGVLAFIGGGFAAPLVGIAGEDTALPMAIVIAAAELGAIACCLLMARRGGHVKPRADVPELGRR
ncbi:multidrug effflux MFS transporter [Cohnella sp. 56]|uniref:multidrug effflux MFS transporter n=1 Tax=Cohnella sp. 56 TaxID=3113722 RepID=UPI0030E8FF10